MRSSAIQTWLLLTVVAAVLSACAPYSTRQDVVRDTPQRILENLDQVPKPLLQDALDTILAAPNPKGETYAMEAYRRPQFQDSVSQNKIISRLLRGESPQSAEFILAQVKANPALLTAEVADWLLKKDPAGAAEIVLSQIKSNAVFQTPAAAEYLVKKDLPGTPDVLFAAARDKPALLTPPVAQYFVDKRYAPFIPMIVSNIEKGENVDQNLKVLSTMNTTESNNALLDLAGKDTPARPAVLRVLPDIKDTEARERAQTVLEETWKNNEPGPLRTTALEGYAAMRGLDPKELERDRAFPMAEAQGDLAVNTLADRAQPSEQKTQPARVVPQDRGIQSVTPAPAPAVRPATPAAPAVPARTDKQEAKTDKKTDAADKKSDKKAEKAEQKDQKKLVEDKRAQPPADEAVPPLDERASAAYRQRLSNLFLDTFGETGGPAVMRRMQDTLATYSESRSSSADFMIRSYRRRYGGSDAVIRKLLARGLRQPDSLGLVVQNIKAEYPSKEMQIYALSRLFALQRWQSQVIIELSQEVPL